MREEEESERESGGETFYQTHVALGILSNGFLHMGSVCWSICCKDGIPCVFEGCVSWR